MLIRGKIMRIVYLPFTFVADSVAKTLSDCFGSFVVYQPFHTSLPDQMQAWKNRGLMELRVPVAGDEIELKQVIQSFRVWADLHGEDLGGGTAKFKARLDSMARLSDMSSSQIVAEIKSHVHSIPTHQIPDRIQASRIFLYFAQEFDRQNLELADELLRSDREQAELIRQLKTEDDPVAIELVNPDRSLADSTDDYLLSNRLESWTRIFLQDSDTSGVLVTHSTGVMERLLECAPAAVQVIKTESSRNDSNGKAENALWQEALTTCLKRLSEEKQEDACTPALQRTGPGSTANPFELTVYQIPDQSPRDLLLSCTSIEPVAADLDSSVRQSNALVALVRKLC
jgi:hypothetical protein